MQREADILKTLRHPNIVTFYEGQFDSQFSGMFLEFVEYGSVDGFLERFSVDIVWKVQIISDVVSAMGYLHGQEPAIIHGDLKCQNILIGRDFRAKICDFGLARIRTISKMKTGGLEGTLAYIAPEYFEDPKKDKTDKFDVYSFAISAWEIFYQKRAYYDYWDRSIISTFVKKGYRPEMADDDDQTPSTVRKIIRYC